jgi:hypothetical protein
VHLYINFLPVLAGEAPAVIGTIMNQLSRYISHNAPKLLKQSVDEIELRFVIGDAAEVRGNVGREGNVRFRALCMTLDGWAISVVEVLHMSRR